MPMRMRSVGCGLAVAAALLCVESASGQVRAVMPLVSFGDRSDAGVGARVAFGVSEWGAAWEGQVDVQLFFPDEVGGLDRGYLEVNANVIHAFDVGRPSLSPYAGAGFNMARWSVSRSGTPFVEDATETDLGLNLLGGLRFGSTGLSPFVEGRIELGGGDQAVLMAGMRIPIG